MKPVAHLIPLTPPERDFVVSVLGDNPLAFNLKLWPEVDGMIEVRLEDADRAAVYDSLGWRWLHRRLQHVRARHQNPQLPLFDGYLFSDGCVSLTGGEVALLTRMFGDYELDTTAVRLALLTAPDHKQFFHHYPDDCVMCAYLRHVAIACGFADDARARPAYHFNRYVCHHAVAQWKSVGLCDWRREEPAGRRKYAHVVIDWIHEMWLPPFGRRKSSLTVSTLAISDDEAELLVSAT
jgi:hypothetical protein